jgi:crotonobetainyl-CoA:carnitine CoA-transferase CaiB-like acyl-CoA transferase
MIGPLPGIRVVDISGPEGQLCGRLFADMGAEVVLVEPPQGSPTRNLGPFNASVAGHESSLLFQHLNAGKKSVVLSLDKRSDRQALKVLTRTSDVLIESFAPGYLDDLGLGYKQLKHLNPGLVSASVTGFGQTGPYAQYKAPSIVASAMGGVMYLCGSPDRPPLAEPELQPYFLASAFAAYDVMLALRHRDSTGRGQQVEVSCQEVQAAMQHVLVNYSSNANILQRAGSRTPIGGGMPYGVYPAADGFAHLVVIATSHWRAFVDWIGRPEALTDPMWDNRHTRIANADLIEFLASEFTKTKSKAELFKEGQERHITVAPINTPAEFADDPHTKAKNTFVNVPHPSLGVLPMVQPPFRFSATPAAINTGAPILGQHTQEILKDLGGQKAFKTPAGRKPGKQPLSGVRVLDFSQAIAGPVLTQLLAEAGAEVIKVESASHQQRGRARPDMDPRLVMQQKVTFADINRNKLSITVNMGTDEGRVLVKRLVPGFDVVVENFSPRVMERWGLGYEDLKKLRHDIIMARLPGFGLDGPYRDYVGLAAVAMGITGMYHLWSYDEVSEPAGPPVWVPDYLSAAFGAAALMAALRHRDATGQGQLIELSQVDATAYVMGHHYLDYFINGRAPQPAGNTHPQFAPHGVYRCQGHDAWCAIAVRDDAEWASMVKAMGSPEEARDKRFIATQDRLVHKKELDSLIEAWTVEHTPNQVMRLLQSAGVPAGVVQSGESLFLDPQLRARGFITSMDYAGTGPVEYPGAYVRLSETPGKLEWCHEMGQDNREVFSGLLGMSADEVKSLEDKGVLS